MAKRLIDAEELKACVKNRLLNGAIISWLFRIIDTCSTVDAVEVVRCKDCKHVEMTPDNLRWHNSWERPPLAVGKEDNMADKINGHDLPKSGLVAVPDSMMVRSFEVRTVHDKIRSLSAPEFTEYLYRTLEATIKANDVDLTFTDEQKTATLMELLQPWEE